MSKDESVRKTMLRLLMVTSSVVIVLTCMLFFAYDLLTFRRQLARQLSTLGGVIAGNSTAALAFDNEQDAGAILSALKADPHIVSAALYNRDGKLFCKYPSTLPDTSFPLTPSHDGIQYQNSYLIAFQSVSEGENGNLGTLYMKSDLGAFSERLRLYGEIVIIVFFISLIAAYALSRVTGRRISQPILSLAETARAVAHRRDYSVRATKTMGGELGLLTDAVNLMLTRIGEQNAALRESEESLRTLNQELEQRVAQRTEQLQEANKELESFSYSVSHDLRAPLRHINGFADLLMQHASTMDERAKRYIGVISQAAARMGNLIDDILEFSRMGRQEIMTSTVCVEDMLTETIAALQNECDGRNIVWKRGPLPDVEADPSMLRQVFFNLLSNSVKYTRPREAAVIEIGVMERPDFKMGAILYVRDNGVGFDMQYADRLFGVFQRLHRTEEFEGTGIGLASVARIINRHGGRIWAESEPDKGATFYFSLPKLKPETL